MIKILTEVIRESLCENGKIEHHLEGKAASGESVLQAGAESPIENSD